MKLVSAPRFVKYAEVPKMQAIFERAQYLETKENTMSKYAGSLNHFFELDGCRLGLSGNTKLNDLVDTYLTEGDFCKIVYKGKTEGKNGNSYHDFDMYVEEDKPLKKVEPATTASNLDSLE